MIRRRLCLVPLVCLWLCVPLAARSASEEFLALDGRIDPSGRAIELSWFDAEPPRVGSVVVKRRTLGETGGASWRTIADNLGPVMRFTDDTIKPGVGYEYQVLRMARDIVDVGYWAAGTGLPASLGERHLYLVVDETVAGEIAPRLERFERDLTGDGWTVLRHLAPRGGEGSDAGADLQAAQVLREWLQAQYFRDPFGQHAVVLLGHLPVVRTGRAAPDGHEPTPHPSDLFYADMTATWPLAPGGWLASNAVPDGHIELQIGRIDFSNMSRERSGEIQLLRSYLDKNHHWRTGLLGDLRTAYGDSEHLTGEIRALRNIVGPEAAETGDHHGAGERRPWLWGVSFGNWNGRAYPGTYANKAVFAINFGSGKQKFSDPFNALTASLAQPFYTVAAGWGGRPTWWLHHMALGGTIGEVHLRTVNNGSGRGSYRDDLDYFPTGRYLWRNPVWVNLLGDPTLHAFPMAPPSGAVVTGTGDGARLSWNASPDPEVTGYHVYRRDPDADGYRLLTPDRPVTATSLVDEATVPGAEYMVRATGLRRVYAGSFEALSQGVYARRDPAPAGAEPAPLVLQARADGIVALPAQLVASSESQVTAILGAPDRGRIFFDGAGWVYAPPEGGAETVRVPVSIFDGFETRTGTLRIDILPDPDPAPQ